MTPEQLSTLQHSLGVDQYGRGTQYRNHFVTDPAFADGILCESLVALGFMQRANVHEELTGGNQCYMVTAAGRKAMLAESPAPPKRTRSQARYLQWLESGAGDCGIPFGKWLKRKATA